MIAEFLARALLFGMLFSTYRKKIKNIGHMKAVVNNRWEIICQELIKSANKPFILKMDSLSIASVNYVTSACCKLYFCLDFALKMSPVLMFFE